MLLEMYENYIHGGDPYMKEKVECDHLESNVKHHLGLLG